MLRDVHRQRLDKIEHMRDDILKAGEEAQEMKRLPDWIVSDLIDEGFSGLHCQPKWEAITQVLWKQ